MTKSWKHCGKRRNCLFWAISSFVTMFYKKPSAAEASERVYMRERVKYWFRIFKLSLKYSICFTCMIGYCVTIVMLNKDKTFNVIILGCWPFPTCRYILMPLPQTTFENIVTNKKQFNIQILLSWIQSFQTLT